MGKHFIRFISIVLICALAFSTISAAAAPAPFVDIDYGDWFYDAVLWAYDKGIMNGINATRFDPYGTMTRAMLVTVLWRYADSPDAGIPSFEDVSRYRWYGTAVAWANESGIVTGISETEFAPNRPINRQEMYTILFRYMNFAGLDIPARDMQLLKFADEADISNWALDSMYFMHDASVMHMLSESDMYARPLENAVRGEIAYAMFHFDAYAEVVSIVS